MPIALEARHLNHGAAAELCDRIRVLKTGDPLEPVTVVVHSSAVGVQLRRRCAERLGARGEAWAGVDFLTPEEVAARLAAHVFESEGRAPLPELLVYVVARRVLSDAAAGAAVGHDSVKRLVDAWQSASLAVSDAGVGRLHPGLRQHALRLREAMQALLGFFYDRAELFSAAVEAPERLAPSDRLGSVILLLDDHQLDSCERALIERLRRDAARGELRLFSHAVGDATAAASQGEPPPCRPGEGPDGHDERDVKFELVATAEDQFDREALARGVTRIVLGLLSEGCGVDGVAVAPPPGGATILRVAENLRRAGIPFVVTGGVPLGLTASGPLIRAAMSGEPRLASSIAEGRDPLDATGDRDTWELLAATVGSAVDESLARVEDGVADMVDTVRLTSALGALRSLDGVLSPPGSGDRRAVTDWVLWGASCSPGPLGAGVWVGPPVSMTGMDLEALVCATPHTEVQVIAEDPVSRLARDDRHAPTLEWWELSRLWSLFMGGPAPGAAPSRASRLETHPLFLEDPLLARAARAWSESREVRFGPWSGDLRSEAPVWSDQKRQLSLSALEDWARCPYAFFVGRVLGVRPPEEEVSDESIPATVIGTVVHEVLERFFRRRQKVGSGARRSGESDRSWTEHAWSGADEELDRLAEAVLGETLERTGGVGAGMRTYLTERVKTLARAALYLAPGDSEILALEHEFKGDRALVIADGDPGGSDHGDGCPRGGGAGVEVRGRIDRVERSGGVLRVIDYKTGGSNVSISSKAPFGKDLSDLQLSVYALVAVRDFGPAAETQVAYWDLAGVRESSTRVDRRDTEVLWEILRWIAGGVRDGLFPMRPGDLSGDVVNKPNCRSCRFDRICPPDRVELALRCAEESPVSDRVEGARARLLGFASADVDSASGEVGPAEVGSAEGGPVEVGGRTAREGHVDFR
ncbi:MAG: hypothetical protein KatS3mg008_1800 [Acidimicrobiales bacterium]|nr:MAG: hypothetical protein KatS3mg008_1800 [Acidimicrobiales bacterium]